MSQTVFTCVQDGYFAYNSCTQYYWCVGTNTATPQQNLYNCGAGTLFDVSILGCRHASELTCPIDNLAAIETTTAAAFIPTLASTTTTGKYSMGIFFYIRNPFAT